jgi:hypothetical protein
MLRDCNVQVVGGIAKPGSLKPASLWLSHWFGGKVNRLLVNLVVPACSYA